MHHFRFGWSVQPPEMSDGTAGVEEKVVFGLGRDQPPISPPSHDGIARAGLVVEGWNTDLRAWFGLVLTWRR